VVALLFLTEAALNLHMEVAQMNQHLATRHQSTSVTNHQCHAQATTQTHALNHRCHAQATTQTLALNHQCHAPHSTQNHAQSHQYHAHHSTQRHAQSHQTVIAASVMKSHHHANPHHHVKNHHPTHPVQAHHQNAAMAVITKNLPADLRLSSRLRKLGLKPTSSSEQSRTRTSRDSLLQLRVSRIVITHAVVNVLVLVHQSLYARLSESQLSKRAEGESNHASDSIIIIS
jgi:hypothetical protein